MKEIIRDDKKFYELKEQELIRLHTRLRLIYEYVDDIFKDYLVEEDFDPSVIASLADIRNQVIEARDILKVTEGHYTIKKSSEGSMSYGDVEQRLETVKSSLEDAISDVDCNLSDRIDEIDEKLGEVYEFYENFPSDWTLEKQLKELAEETVKVAVDPIVKRQIWLEKRLSKLEIDMKQRIEENRIHADAFKGFDERLKLLSKNVQSIYDDVASLRENVNNANITANAACNNPRIEKLEKELNGINAVQGGHRLELDGLNRKLDQIRADVNKNKRALIILKENVSKLNVEERAKEYMSATLEETTDESVEDRLSKLEKAFDVMSAVCPKYHK